MAEKAELDILEIELPVPEGGQDGGVPPEGGDDSGERRGSLLRKGLLGALILILCTAGIVSWLYFGAGRDDKAGKEQAGISGASGARFVSLEHFMVNLRDGQGNYRVLVCDVVLEMNPGWETAGDRSPDLRKIIYRTVRTNVDPILQKSAKIRRQILKEIEKNVNGTLGEGAIRQVYFTKYMLL